MKSSATVQGDLYYGQLSVEAGAKALGTFRMGVAKKSPTSKQVRKQSQKTASKADALASLKASTMPSESSSVMNDEITVGSE